MLLALLAATPAPTPVPVAPDDITPGVIGFLAVLAIAAATVLLIVDMNRRIRRTRYRAAAEERRGED